MTGGADQQGSQGAVAVNNDGVRRGVMCLAGQLLWVGGGAPGPNVHTHTPGAARLPAGAAPAPQKRTLPKPLNTSRMSSTVALVGRPSTNSLSASAFVCVGGGMGAQVAVRSMRGGPGRVRPGGKARHPRRPAWRSACPSETLQCGRASAASRPAHCYRKAGTDAHPCRNPWAAAPGTQSVGRNACRPRACRQHMAQARMMGDDKPRRCTCGSPACCLTLRPCQLSACCQGQAGLSAGPCTNVAQTSSQSPRRMGHRWRQLPSLHAAGLRGRAPGTAAHPTCACSGRSHCTWRP